MGKRFSVLLAVLLIVSFAAGCAAPLPSRETAALPSPAVSADYGRAMLRQNECAAYDAILSAALAGEDAGVLDPLSADGAARAIHAVKADHPLLDQAEISAPGDPARAFSIVWSTPLQKGSIEAAAAPLLADLPDRPAQRAAAIHDRLLDRITYRSGQANPVDGTLYGGLVNGAAVCNGFSRSFQYLCQRAGIPCYFIEGTSIRGIPHSWNMVLLDGEWYYVDVTWDASSYPRCYHDYFLLSLKEMEREHFPEPGTPPLPAGGGRNYYERFGYAADTGSRNFTGDMADAFLRQLRDFPPEAAGKAVFMEIQLTGSRYREGREQFQKSLFPLLVKINQEARRLNLPFGIETTGPVEYNFNDNTRVVTIFPVAKRLA